MADSENSEYFKIAELAFVYFLYLGLAQTFFKRVAMEQPSKIIIVQSRIL